MPIKVLQVGLGPIGAAVLRQVAARSGLTIVGVVDTDSAKVGRDAGQVAGLSRKLRLPVRGDLKAAVSAARPDIAILCTASSLSGSLPTIEAVLKHKIPIVSTIEELAFPVRSRLTLARRIDLLAKRARVAVAATGVNPGFTMDALPIALTSVCERVDRIEVDRVQDARHRRVPFQQKVGAGLTVDEFAAGVRDGRIRHVGLAESIAMIAEAMGWRIDRVTDVVQPKIAEARVASDAIVVEPGQVAGLLQDGVGYAKGQPVIKLHMEAWFGAPRAYDRARIFGSPSLDMTIDGGVPGDVATASIVVNSIPKVIRAAPGLRTMLDLALPSFGAR